jgi:hypothetical protein
VARKKLPHVSNGAVFALLCQHGKKPLKERPRLRMKALFFVDPEVIVKGGAVGVGASVVDLGSGNAVTDHLKHVAKWHFDAFPFPGFLIHLDPVFIMVGVSSLVVEPRCRIPPLHSFCSIGTSVPLIVAYTAQKLNRRIFRKVVEQPLAVKPHSKAELHYNQLV